MAATVLPSSRWQSASSKSWQTALKKYARAPEAGGVSELQMRPFQIARIWDFTFDGLGSKEIISDPLDAFWRNRRRSQCLGQVFNHAAAFDVWVFGSKTRSVVSRVAPNINQQRWLLWLLITCNFQLSCCWINLMPGHSQPGPACGHVSIKCQL